jgi:flagellar protein FliL
MNGKTPIASKADKMPVSGKANGPADPAQDGEVAPASLKGGRKKLLILLAAPLLLAGLGGGLVATGMVSLPFVSHAKPPVGPVPPVFVALPEIIANLDAGPDGESYVKLKAALKLPGPEAAARLNAEMPAVVDMFQSYLRAMHPDDLRGAEGTYRLREALLARANVVAAPTPVLDVLFSELIVQ